MQRITAELSGAKIECVTDASIEKDAVVLEVAEGRINGYSAAARYIAGQGNGSLLGGSAVEKS
jgi:hypothetical protein